MRIDTKRIRALIQKECTRINTIRMVQRQFGTSLNEELYITPLLDCLFTNYRLNSYTYLYLARVILA